MKRVFKIKFLFAANFFLAVSFLLAQDQTASQKYYGEFVAYCGETEIDTASIRKLLMKWEKEIPKDAELFTSYFNYYIIKARKQEKRQIIEYADSIPGDKYLDIIYYDEEQLKPGFDYLEKGIKLHPNRLDMYFGKIHMLGELEKYENQKEEIFKVIDLSLKNKNAWLWSFNETKPDAKNFMLACIQDYVVKMYDNGKTEPVKQIATKVLTVYPGHIDSYLNTGVAYFIEKNYDQALEYLFKANKIEPKNTIVLSNIAWAYAQKQEFKKAISWYEKVVKYGDEDTKSYANKQISDLKNK